MREEKFASCTLSDFLDLLELYRSSTGTVYRGRFKYDNKQYVLKERKAAELGRRKDIMNEVKLLQQLHHQNIVQCEGWFRDVSNSHTLYIVLEYCDGGDLNSMIESRRRSKQRFEERDVWLIFHQVCCGVKALHENGIVHRDVKALNILMHKQQSSNAHLVPARPIFKVSDLGVSRQVSERTLLLNTFYGTPLYLSPEIVENKPYNEKTDIWSLGVLLYELCALYPPFIGKNLVQVTKSIQSGVYDKEPLSRYSKDISKCIRWTLQREFSNRPNIIQLLDMVTSKLVDGYGGEDLLRDSSPSPARIVPPRPVADRCQQAMEDSSDNDADGSIDEDSLDGGATPPDNVEDLVPETKPVATDLSPVSVDVMRCHMKHRKEAIKFRKLLQVRDYFQSDKDAIVDGEFDLNNQIKEAKAAVELLEEGIARGVLSLFDARRLDVLPRPKPPPVNPERHPVAEPDLIRDDSLPVYLQPPPRKQSPQARRSNNPNNDIAAAGRINERNANHGQGILFQVPPKDDNPRIVKKAEDMPKLPPKEPKRPSISFAVHVHSDSNSEDIRVSRDSNRRLHQAVAYGKDSSEGSEKCNGLLLPSMADAVSVVDKRGNSSRPRPKSAAAGRRLSPHDSHSDKLRNEPRTSEGFEPNPPVPPIYEEVHLRPATAFATRHVHGEQQEAPSILSDKERLYSHQRAFSDVTDAKKQHVSISQSNSEDSRQKERSDSGSSVAKQDSEPPSRQFRHKKSDIVPTEQHIQYGYDAAYQKAKGNHHFHLGNADRKGSATQKRQERDYNIITGGN